MATSGRPFLGNVGWNLAGQGLPLGVAVVAIPVLVRGLGVSGYGLLVLAWAFLGYSSLFDLGLGRALTQLLARGAGSGRNPRQEAELTWTALALMGALGLAGAAAVLLAGLPLAGGVLHLEGSRREDFNGALILLAACIPVVTVSAGLRGILEAHQRFRAANLVRLPLGVLTFLGPMAVLPVAHGGILAPVASLLAVRIAAAGAYLALCLGLRRGLADHVRVVPTMAGPLLRFGGWMTVSNLIGPLLSYLDRFLIGSAISLAAVALYATPSEMMLRLWVIAGSVAGVLFPLFASSIESAPERAAELYRRGLFYVFAALLPVAVLGVAMARPVLATWLGPEFAAGSAGVMGWLAIGLLLNGLAQVPFALIQGAGRADLTAKLHLLEVVPYLVALGLLVRFRGIDGAAMAWTARAGVDLALLLGVGSRLLPRARSVTPRLLGALAGALAICLACSLTPDVRLRLAAAGIGLGLFAVLGLRARGRRPAWLTGSLLARAEGG